ncbi:MAG: hypothetical protein JRE43_01870 [Deltaproteobacteria bacterium]|nr:hypothetical protein [Deltaproteobacteria bacterium]MBW2541317.1 hypothetical protein [Deltaproteobacteria bacterium]
MELIQKFLFIAEVSYVLVGLDLLRRAKMTRGLPELFLGLAFVCNGFSYFFADFPILTENDAIMDEFSYVGRIFAGLCSMTIAVFAWRVFRPESSLARWSVWTIGALLVTGAVVSAIEGDWVGAYPLTYRGFWFEWVGGAVPFVWLAAESLRSYSQMRLRMRIGLADPLVTNRFLLIGLYGLLATITYPTFLWMYIVYERYGTWSDPIGTFAGVVELVSLAALWTSISAPAFYRRWVCGAQASS